jgi:hypothetical protein
VSISELSRFDARSTGLPRQTQTEPRIITPQYIDHGVIELSEIDRPHGRNWPTRWVEASEMPAVEPGQLWFVELPAGGDVSPLERRALTSANVVIYDRTLADTVAAILPLGAYAEPAVAADAVPDQSLERSLRFVLDGWSVVRLIDPAELPLRERVEEIRGLSDRLLAIKSPRKLPIILFASEDAAALWKTEPFLDTLGATIDQCAPESRVALVFGAVRARSAPTFSIASSNGLAG